MTTRPRTTKPQALPGPRDDAQHEPTPPAEMHSHGSRDDSAKSPPLKPRTCAVCGNPVVNRCAVCGHEAK